MSGLFRCINAKWQRPSFKAINTLFFLLFLLFLLHFLFLRLLPLSFCWLSIRPFDHGLGRLLACSLQDGFNAQIVDVVRGHTDIDH